MIQSVDCGLDSLKNSTNYAQKQRRSLNRRQFFCLIEKSVINVRIFKRVFGWLNEAWGRFYNKFWDAFVCFFKNWRATSYYEQAQNTVIYNDLKCWLQTIFAEKGLEASVNYARERQRDINGRAVLRPGREIWPQKL